MSGRRVEGISCRTNHLVTLPPSVTQGPGSGGEVGGQDKWEQGQRGPASSVRQNPSPENRGGKRLLRQPHVNRPVHPGVALETCGQLQLCLRLSSSHQEPKMAEQTLSFTRGPAGGDEFKAREYFCKVKPQQEGHTNSLWGSQHSTKCQQTTQRLSLADGRASLAMPCLCHELPYLRDHPPSCFLFISEENCALGLCPNFILWL